MPAQYTAWALHVHDVGLLGTYCWPATVAWGRNKAWRGKPITFRSRKDARRAKKRLTSYRSEAKVVKVVVTVAMVERS